MTKYSGLFVVAMLMLANVPDAAAVWGEEPSQQDSSVGPGQLEAKDAEGYYQLGQKYRLGEGVKQDYARAAEWYRKAAEQGHAAAQGHLGVMYASGEGVKQDYAQAVEWYRKSAEQGAFPGPV